MSSKSVETILAVISECETAIHNAQDELEFCNRKTQDLLHELEIETLSYHERAKLAMDLMDIRKRRRAAKDIIELDTPLLEWANNQVAPINALKRCLGEMRKVENKQANRVYFRRAGDSDGDMIIESK